MNKIIAEWVYEPKNYFENIIVVEEDKLSLKISDGIIELILNNYKTVPEDLHNQYEDFVKSYFYKRMLEVNKKFYIKAASKKEINNNGNVIISPKLEPMRISVSFSANAHIIKKDMDGNIIYDSKVEEEKEQKKLLDKIQSSVSKEKIVSKILNSYNSALSNPANELVYLYDIREALKFYFGNEQKARTALNISKKDWSEAGRICNDLPVKQGRHRGACINDLRDATNVELQSVREIIKIMIKSFVEYIG